MANAPGAEALEDVPVDDVASDWAKATAWKTSDAEMSTKHTTK
jgi:hypothetical protein